MDRIYIKNFNLDYIYHDYKKLNFPSITYDDLIDEWKLIKVEEEYKNFVEVIVRHRAPSAHEEEITEFLMKKFTDPVQFDKFLSIARDVKNNTMPPYERVCVLSTPLIENLEEAGFELKTLKRIEYSDHSEYFRLGPYSDPESYEMLLLLVGSKFNNI